MTEPMRGRLWDVTATGPFEAHEDRFIIRNVGYMTYREMARQLGRAESSVRGRLERLRSGPRSGKALPAKTRGTATRRTTAVGDVVDVDRNLSAKDKPKIARGRVTHVYERFAVVQFRHYREAWHYNRITVVRAAQHDAEGIRVDQRRIGGEANGSNQIYPNGATGTPGRRAMA